LLVHRYLDWWSINQKVRHNDVLKIALSKGENSLQLSPFNSSLYSRYISQLSMCGIMFAQGLYAALRPMLLAVLPAGDWDRELLILFGGGGSPARPDPGSAWLESVPRCARRRLISTVIEGTCTTIAGRVRMSCPIDVIYEVIQQRTFLFTSVSDIRPVCIFNYIWPLGPRRTIRPH